MLIRNSALYMVAKLLPGLFGLATAAALTRLLEPKEYGLYGLTLVVMTLGSLIIFDWLGLSFLRFYQSRRDDPNLAPTFICMFLALATVSAVALGAALISGVVPADLVGASVVGLLMVWASSWFELVARLAVAEFQPIKYLTMNFARSLLVLVGATAAAWLTTSPLWTAMGTGVGIFAGSFFGRIPVPRPSWRRFDRGLARDVVVFGAPMAASLALCSLIDGGNRVLLEQLDSARALGLYTAASVLAQSTLGFIGAGVASAGYSLAVLEIERGDHTAARRQLLGNGTILLAVLAPASLGIALTGNCIATTLVGSKFVSGVAPLMPWMAANSFFNSMRANHLDHAFQLGKKSHLQIWVMGLAGIVAIGLSLYLIPKEGPIGVATAVTVAQAVACVHSMIAGRYAYPIPLPVVAGARVGFCCVMMAFVVVQLPDSGWIGLFLRVTLGSGTYALAAIAVNLLDTRVLAAHFVKSIERRWLGAGHFNALRSCGVDAGREPQSASKSGLDWRVAPATFAILALGGGWLTWSLNRGTTARYVTQKIERGSIVRSVTTSGIVCPTASTQVGAGVSGMVQALYCDANMKVKAGQLCAKIDPRPYQVVADHAKARLAATEARFEKDKANLARAKLVFVRHEVLAKRRAISRKSLENARKPYARAQAQALRDQTSIAKRQAALHAAEITLGYTDIISPIDGTIVSSNVELGQTVAAGSATPPLFLIARDLTVMQVNANVGENDGGKVNLGDKASFTVKSFPNQVFVGEVTQIHQSPRTIQNVTTYDVVIRAANPDLLLKPGMTAMVRIVVDRRDHVIRAPNQALRSSPRDLTVPNGADDPRAESDQVVSYRHSAK